jgi:hypothetical protein
MLYTVRSVVHSSGQQQQQQQQPNQAGLAAASEQDGPPPEYSSGPKDASNSVKEEYGPDMPQGDASMTEKKAPTASADRERSRSLHITKVLHTAEGKGRVHACAVVVGFQWWHNGIVGVGHLAHHVYGYQP